jgi:hypothetical protein
VWNEEDEEEDDNMEWDDVAYIGEDPGLADEERERELVAMEALNNTSRTPDTSMEDPGRWNTDMTIEEMQAQAKARQQQQQQPQWVPLPNALMPGGGFGQQQLHQPQQNQRETLTVEQQQRKSK